MNSRKHSHNGSKHYKSKSKKKLIFGVVISSLILLIIAGYAVYKVFIVPKMIEPALEKVAEVMQDEKYTSAITNEIRRLYEAGQISGPDIEQYLKQHDAQSSEYIPDAVSKNDSDTPPESDPDSNSSDSSQKENDSSSNKNNDTSKSSMGVNTVKIRDENTSVSNGSRYSENSTSKEYNLDSSDKTPSKPNYSSIYERAKAVMTPSDYSTAIAIGSKIDTNKAKSLMNDREALIAYVQSTLTPDEYSTGLSLYAKYYNAIIE